MIKGQKHIVDTSKLQEHLLAKGYDQESVDIILLVSKRSLDCLDDLFREFFREIEDNVDQPELGIPEIYVDGVILGMTLYLKFLPNFFREMTAAKIESVQAYGGLVEEKPMIEEEVPPENGPS